ncbi:FecR domain-containing protein [Vibrio sp. T11.5]|uniref:FecR domain-containing protein n=1 Tax=Vibrio sp. T11.5 TaxID=2998836 RepID=UPI0022CD37D8|nr:FecR domain-containing protein [Vibrio sp. T11.5]MDA0120102.1 FecR domain-containing protein [Vibrio sp. T11.5]
MERVSRKSIEQASLWMARMWSDDVTEQDKRALDLWRTRHPDNDYAWRQMESLQQKLTSLPDPHSGSKVLGTYRQRVSRRQVLVWGGVSLATMSLVLSSDAAMLQGETEYASATGEVKPVRLSDGTVVVLNTASRMRVDFNQHQRIIRLMEGEIMLTTGHHLTPFHVITPQGSVTPIGTKFSVRLESEQTRVSVFEGEVIAKSQRQAQGQHLLAGEKSEFSAYHQGRKQSLLATDALWLEEKILAHDTPLPEFITELSRYRRGVIKVSPELSALRISGVYSIRDTDQTLENLRQLLPIEVHFRTRFWVSISSKSA